jgi:hypothetical protein
LQQANENAANVDPKMLTNVFNVQIIGGPYWLLHGGNHLGQILNDLRIILFYYTWIIMPVFDTKMRAKKGL